MGLYRKDRLTSEIVKETSKILLHELRDPRCGFFTVTRAKVSTDYKYATIYVSVMGTPREKKSAMIGLKHAAGFVQRELSRRIKIRVFPEVRFELDESIAKAFEVMKLIEAANPKKRPVVKDTEEETETETGKEAGKETEEE